MNPVVIRLGLETRVELGFFDLLLFQDKHYMTLQQPFASNFNCLKQSLNLLWSMGKWKVVNNLEMIKRKATWTAIWDPMVLTEHV